MNDKTGTGKKSEDRPTKPDTGVNWLVSYPGADNPPFRLSMLIYDRRYRSLTLQAIVFILVMLLASWLINNTLQNLAALGQNAELRLSVPPRGI